MLVRFLDVVGEQHQLDEVDGLIHGAARDVDLALESPSGPDLSGSDEGVHPGGADADARQYLFQHVSLLAWGWLRPGPRGDGRKLH
ncbi:hypothetical protein D3C86_2000940 [compost metagenome]